MVACKRNSSNQLGSASASIEYPETYKAKTVDNYFGTKVADPYRWLENNHSDSSRQWITSQNRITANYLSKIPYREQINERLTALWNYEQFRLPVIKNKQYYFLKNDGTQNQAILYAQNGLRADSLTVVLDPNQFSEDGTSALTTHRFSKDGQYLAFSITEGGSDWRTIHVKDLKNQTLLKDKINWVKFSDIAWAGNGFYYSRYPEPNASGKLSQKNEFHQVYYHEIGTSQAEDKIIFADRTNAQRNFYAKTTSDEQFLALSVSESTSGNALYFKTLRQAGANFIPIYENFDYDFEVIGNVNEQLLVLTNYQAPKYQLLLIDSKNPETDNWQQLIPESGHVLQSAHLIGGKIVARYIKNAMSHLKIFSLEGEFEQNIRLPDDVGTVTGISGTMDRPYLFYAFQSFTRPTTIYQYDVTQQSKSAIFKSPKIDFNSSAYETIQIFYYSYDSTKIPMFITYKKGLKLDKRNPTLLYGYGGFNISIMPRFSVEKAAFLEQGGIFAVANIRGGGEFGERWHKEGTVLKKQNVFDDFLSASEYLIQEGFTASDKLAIEGRSNGGLLVGACMTQRPDLFKVAFPGVGVMDMLRYHKFTIGWAWATDYGTSEDSTQFRYLYDYSPLHNLQPANYPATLVTTADHDDRVVPAHSYKFAATLQENHQGKTPVLIRIDTKAGHGSGKSTKMRIAEATDKLSFLFFNMQESFSWNRPVLD